MALSIKDQEIIGEIDKLEEKLSGKLPVDRLELLYLVNSWGRTNFSYAKYLNEEVKIKKCGPNHCYDLSKLDVSQITNMDSIFCFSNFTDIYSRDGIKLHNGDISKWDVSNVTSMYGMFGRAKKFNSDISNWDVSNVTSMRYMFFYAINFNKNISKWNLEGVKRCFDMFDDAKDFELKYNSGKPLPNKTEDIKEWFNLNRDKMNEIDIKEKHGEEVDNFFNKIQTNSIQKKEI